MTTERDLDRLIDEAARRMAQREPSEGLSHAVMARVAARPSHFAHHGLMWGTAAGAAAIVAVVMLVIANRTVPSVKAPLQAQGSRLTAQGSGLRAQGSGKEQAVDSSAQSPRVAVVDGRNAEPVLVDGDEAVEMTDPITFDVITPAPIEVDVLEIAAAPPITPVEIASIPIEPISASND